MEKNKKNVILTDFNVHKDWSFCTALSSALKSGFEVECCTCNGGIGKRKRLMKYATYPFKIFLHRKEYRMIVAWQQFYGLFFAFYCRLFHVRKACNLYIMTFIYLPKKGIKGGVFEWFMKFVVQSKYVDKLIVFSESEVSHYARLLNLPENKLAFVPYYQEKLPPQKDDEAMKARKYILTVGRSNRDYAFLVHALNGTSYQVELICDGYILPGESKNITVRHHVFTQDMRWYMHNCYCVVIPLKDLNVSSGQLVLLQAMQLKKPIVITRTNGVKDYIIDGYNGLMIHNTRDDLLNALGRLYNDKALYDTLVANAYRDVTEKFSLSAFASNLERIINI